MSQSCPGFDEIAWGQANRVELYEEKIQVWIVAHSFEDSQEMKPSGIRHLTAMALWKWFGGGVTEMPRAPIGQDPLTMGPADLIDIGVPSSEPPELPSTLQSWGRLPGPLPLLRPGRVVYVPVQFAWRSTSVHDLPWPTRRSAFLTLGACPVDANAILYSVGSPTKDAEGQPPPAPTPGQTPSATLPQAPPPPPGLIDRIEKVLGEKADALKEAVTPSVPSWVPWVAGGLAAAYVLNSMSGAVRSVRGG